MRIMNYFSKKLTDQNAAHIEARNLARMNQPAVQSEVSIHGATIQR